MAATPRRARSTGIDFRSDRRDRRDGRGGDASASAGPMPFSVCDQSDRPEYHAAPGSSATWPEH